MSKVTVSTGQYVKWNELWLAVERLITQWGDDGAHGTELAKALADAERIGQSRDEPDPPQPPPPVCDTCGEIATNSAQDMISRLSIPPRTFFAGEDSGQLSSVGERRYGCFSHPAK